MDKNAILNGDRKDGEVYIEDLARFPLAIPMIV
jgi:hypothetical protein